MKRMVFSIVGLMVVSLLLARPSFAQERASMRQDAVKSAGASSAGRLALLIGNSAYISGGNLRNPVNDVRDVKAALEELGFRVIKYENCTQRSMKEAIDDFGEDLRGHEVGLFFYAGHGVQVGGENYLVPVDAKLQSEKVVEYDCVRADRVLAMMEGAGSKTNIVILDACRDNPFERSWRRGGAGRGLAFMNAPSGALIAYATAPGRTAGDGTGRNGVYTAALLDHIRTAGITIEQMFKRVRVTVEERTNKAQTPWESTSLRGEFYFLAGGTPVARVNTAGPTAIPDPLAEERARLEKEREELARLKTQEEKRKIEEERQRLGEERKKFEVERVKPQPAPGPADGQEVGRDGTYIAYANGIVKDTKTGLEWVVGPDRSMTWNEAKAWVESLNVGGGGWRMPTMKELKGLYQYGKGSRNITPMLKITGYCVWSGQSSGGGHMLFDFARGLATDAPPIWRITSRDDRAFAVRTRGDG